MFETREHPELWWDPKGEPLAQTEVNSERPMPIELVGINGPATTWNVERVVYDIQLVHKKRWPSGNSFLWTGWVWWRGKKLQVWGYSNYPGIYPYQWANDTF